MSAGLYKDAERRARHMAFMEGWREGAGMRAMSERYKDTPHECDYSDGYTKGCQAMNGAMETASERYDYSPGSDVPRWMGAPMSAPVPMVMYCPDCSGRHIDEGVFATKPHHTHACQHCGMVWRPAIVPTVGVRFLPGFKNETERTP